MCSNINGLRNNFTELKYVIRQKKPDIVFLNETHVTDLCDTSDLKINNYCFVNCPSHSVHTGGVCAFINKNIKYSKISVINEQIAWLLSFEIVVNKASTTFAGVYLSSKNEHKKETLDLLEQWLETISLGKSSVFCGDFNIDVASDSSYSRRLIKMCDDNGFAQLTNLPTRVTNESSTIIDLCLSNIDSSKISCSVSSEDQISDHAILEIIVQGARESLKSKERQIRIWKNYDERALWEHLESNLFSWRFVQTGDVNEKMEWLLNIIEKSTNQFKSSKTIKTNSEFFDHELENMRREKNRLYKLAQLSIDTLDSETNWHAYKLYKNDYKKSIRIKKYEANQTKFNRVQGNMKGTWKVLQSILNKDNSEITRIKTDNLEFDDDLEIANEFNKFFIRSIIELNNNIPNIQYDEEAFVSQQQFEFRPVSISEIKKCLLELKNNTDEYFINPNVLLDAIFVIGQHLVTIINESFESGNFPQILKKSTIVPIQKKAGSIQIEDHRPINTLPCVERLIESLAHNQLNNYIVNNKLLNQNQSGFRENHSCETAINDVMYEWKQAQNDSKIIIAVFLDFQRAFETIDPQLLVHKLSKYGVQAKSLDWFESYLSNRRQVVRIGEQTSSELSNELGVPQGSILGPLLFILYINYITKCLNHSKAKMFADDTLVYIIADSIEIAAHNLNNDLDILYNKLCQNKLKLNVNKTKVMIISNKKIDKKDVNIYISGTKLEIESEIKYLGTIIDENLSFDKNVNSVCKKIGHKASVMSRLSKELNINQKTMLYKTIVEPHFTYCASLLFLSSESDLQRLQMLQNKCLRSVLNVNRFTHSADMLENLKLMNVSQIIKFRTLILIFKIIKGETPQYLSEKISYRNENQIRNLRNANEICPTNAIKACSQNALFYKGIKLFNTLPNEIKQSDSLVSFQKPLKNYILANY